MKNKPFEMCLLFDFYGEMLTRQAGREMFDLYYNEDLSSRRFPSMSASPGRACAIALSARETYAARHGAAPGACCPLRQDRPHDRPMLSDVHRLRLINSNQPHNPEISRVLARLDENLKAIAGGRTL